MFNSLHPFSLSFNPLDILSSFVRAVDGKLSPYTFSGCIAIGFKNKGLAHLIHREPEVFQ